MRVLVGLGNPGREYAGNRHNVGFMAVDAFAASHGLSLSGGGLFSRRASGAWKDKFHGHLAEVTVGGEKCLLLKPKTYMNRSGRSVGELLNFYKIPPSDCLVVHDEIDLPFGELRAKQGGGHAGHNGLKDIDAAVGKDYWRLRVGVGHPGNKDLVADYVLSDFSKEEKAALPEIIGRCEDVMRAFVEEGVR